MPEMDGPTLMKELKKRKPDIKIIFVSGYAEDAFDKSLPDQKQFYFLAKPFTLKQLVKVVKETMAGGVVQPPQGAPPGLTRGAPHFKKCRSDGLAGGSRAMPAPK